MSGLLLGTVIINITIIVVVVDYRIYTVITVYFYW